MNIRSGISFIVLSLMFLIFFSGCAGTPVPPGVGIGPDGSIPAPAPPPSSSNCVSSFVDPGEDGVHGIPPISRGTKDARSAQNAILDILKTEERTEILTDVPGYIHSVQYTKMWRFPDDIEFWFPEDEMVIHFRSAARLGKGDFGVNRERMERIRTLYSGE